jgi:hypothetical protein
MIETGSIGPSLYTYTVQKNEHLAKEKELCEAYDQLQRVIILF